MKEFVSLFPKAIPKARKENGYTPSEVSEAVSVTVRQKMESGRKHPGIITASRLIMFLQINTEDFREDVGLVVPVHFLQRSSLLR